MQNEYSVSVPQSGMNRDVHPSELKNAEYRFALNANADSEDEGVRVLQNEPSNILCSQLDGFKVVGLYNNIPTSTLYLWMINPSTSVSKLCTMEVNGYVEHLPDEQVFVGGEVQRVLSDSNIPQSGQQAICGSLKTLISDEGDPNHYLGFSLAHPIKTIVMKREKCGTSIHWAQDNMPPRHLDLWKLKQDDGKNWYSYIGEPECGDYSNCKFVPIACDKLRTFPLRKMPCVSVDMIQTGGMLRAGTYQPCIACCDQFGNETSDYNMSVSPITIMNPNDNTVVDGKWGGNTGMGVKLNISNVDENTSHYKIVFIQHTVGPDGELTASEDFFVEGVHPSSEKSVYYLSDKNKERTNLQHLFATRPVYNTAMGVASTDRKLLLYGLTADNEWNLQPIANILGSFLYWQSSYAGEDLYKSGVSVSKYGGYMRNEVYPFGIRFVTYDGYKTAIFPLIPPPATSADESVVVGGDGTIMDMSHEKELGSVVSNQAECVRVGRTKRWQFFNTAKEIGIAPSSESGGGGPMSADCKNVVEVDRVRDFVYDYAAYTNNAGLITMTFNLDSIFHIEDDVRKILEHEIKQACHGGGVPGFDTLICEILTGNDGAQVNQYLLPKPVFDIGHECSPPQLVSRKVSFKDIVYRDEHPKPDYVLKEISDYKPVDKTKLFDDAMLMGVDASMIQALYGSSSLPSRIASDLQANLFTKIAESFNTQHTVYRSDVKSDVYRTAFFGEFGSSMPCTSAVPIHHATIDEPLYRIDIPIIHSQRNGIVFFDKYPEDISCRGALHEVRFALNNRLKDLLWRTNAKTIPYALDLSNSKIASSVSDLIYSDSYQEINSSNWDADAPYNTKAGDRRLGEGLVSTYRSHCGVLPLNQPYLLSSETDDGDGMSLGWHSQFNEGDFYYGMSNVADRLEATPLMGSVGDNGPDSVKRLVPYKFFHKQLSKNARWIKIDRPAILDQPNEYVILDVGGLSVEELCVLRSDVSMGDMQSNQVGSLRVRLTFFQDCRGTVMKNPINKKKEGVILTAAESHIYKLTADDFISTNGEKLDTIYLAIDTPLFVLPYLFFQADDDTSKCRCVMGASFGCSTLNSGYSVTLRQKEVKTVKLSAKELIFKSSDVFRAKCRVCADGFANASCEAAPYKYGNFGYWESTEKYPTNKTLYDSSWMTFSQGMVDGKYASVYPSIESVLSKSYGMLGGKLSAKSNMCGKPVRHYKFPDGIISPFMGQSGLVGPSKSVIYPMGVTIDDRIVQAFLDIAVGNGIITREQRRRISGYEIFRGDRRLNKSVIGTGLAFDMFKYKDSVLEGERSFYYANYPYNDLNPDKYIYDGKSRSDYIKHPFGGDGNNKYVLYSPDTSYEKSSLPQEILLEGYQRGMSYGRFVELIGHPKWIIVGQRARHMASIMCKISMASGLLSSINITGNWITSLISTGASFIGNLFNGWLAYAQNYNSWINAFRNMGKLTNYAYYYTSYGNYNSFEPNGIQDNCLRGVYSSKYLSDGLWNILDKNEAEGVVRINHRLRESCVFVSFGEEKYKTTYPDGVRVLDNSRVSDLSLAVTVKNNVKHELSEYSETTTYPWSEQRSDIIAPYIRMQNYIPNQYGSVDNIHWVSTGGCNLFDDKKGYRSIFGGDIFITRHSLRRQFPYFYQTGYNLGDMLPFAYNEYRNVGYPVFYVDFLSDQGWADSPNIGSRLFPMAISSHRLNNPYNFKEEFYEYGKFYTASFGFPTFMVESEINCNHRLSGIDIKDKFFPDMNDYEVLSQEKNVPIGLDNKYLYNNVMRMHIPSLAARTLPSTYDKSFYDCAYQRPNGVIWSMDDVSENSINDPWLIFKPLNFFEFPSSNGRLIHMKGIESTQVLVRFENKSAVYNAVDVLRDRLNQGDADLGSGGLFAGRPLEYSNTEMGHTGTQSTELISCEFGHFWVNSKSGGVMHLAPNGGSIRDITDGVKNWMAEHLPFKILRYGITTDKGVLSSLDVDNKYSGIGLSLGWDNKFKRLFVTKRDYIPVKPASSYKYRDGAFYYNGGRVELSDSSYFKDVSFTIGFSCRRDKWISYYSFCPDFYVNHPNFFQTGLNFGDSRGLWSHLLTNQSYQVFYGKMNPFIVEIPDMDNMKKGVFSVFNYDMDSRRYHSRVDFATKRIVGFNKMTVYNETNSSGLMNLIPSDKNDMRQKLIYPKTNSDSRDILVTEDVLRWSVNDFFNFVKNDVNNIPLFNKDDNDIIKTVNMDAMSYSTMWHDRLKGGWFLIRLENDVESRFKMIFKWGISSNKTLI